MTKFAQSTLLAALFTISAAAQTLTGTATNGTTNKPAAGDEIILISLANGMDESAKTKADSNGKFSFTLPDSGPHLIRAVHQGVTYHAMATPGTKSVEIQVFDVAKKIDGISVTADVSRYQASGGELQGTRLFAVDNQSSPKKTQMNDHNFEFYLPAGAKVEEAQARAPNGQPISAEVTPQAEKNRYAVVFPLRPGETQIQLQFTLPYSGEIKLDPKPLYPAEHVVVVVPKTMQFTAANPAQFQSMDDPNQNDTLVEVAQRTQAGQSLAFTLKGTGTISETPQQTASGAAQQQGRDSRPGGGLGAPIDAPDPLQQYRLPIILGFVVLLAVGGWVVMKRKPAAATPGPQVSADVGVAARLATTQVAQGSKPAGTASSGTSASAAATPPNSSMLLDALKEELFQLEVERRQGKITQAEYDKAKEALDHTLDRALKRKG